MTQPREPIFNIPAVVIGALAVFAAVYVLRAFLLTDEQDLDFLLWFAFIPARYDTTVLLQGGLPGGFGAQVWTFVTYAPIHADLAHIGMNSLWFLPFGSAVARRFGPARFLMFFAVTAAAGACVVDGWQWQHAAGAPTASGGCRRAAAAGGAQ